MADNVPAKELSGPLVPMPVAPHYVIGDVWQTSYYDPSSQAALDKFVKLPAGPADLETGRLTGENFDSTGLWKQV